MKRTNTFQGKNAFSFKRAPIALAAGILLHGFVHAQPATNTTSSDLPSGTASLFESAGQEGIGPRPFSSFLERLSSPVEKIQIKVASDNLAADGVTGTEVVVRLLDRQGQEIRADVDVTLEVDGGARVLLPGSLVSQSPSDRGDIDRIQPGIQVAVKGGLLKFKLIAPYKPELVNLKVSVKGTTEKISVRYIPELRDLIAVGLLEGRLSRNKFDPSQIVPVRENDGFEEEIRNVTKEFNGGKGNLGVRGALYLKGKVSRDYLLTLSYDSEKFTNRKLFNNVNENDFYPVYGDSSVRGSDAQSSSKLYVRVDDKLSYLLFGDYTTSDPNPARSLSQYSRSLLGLRGHYEEGAVTANAFASRQALSQVVDEFSGRGVSGPYSVSRSNGIEGSEKIEILVRDRNQPSTIIKITPLARSFDYEFEPFSGQILFKAPVPSVDDQFNPVSIRVTYEVDQGGASFNIYGGDVNLKLTESLTVGVAYAKDENPTTPFTIAGANLLLKLSKNTEILAEVARAESVAGASSGNFTVNNSNNFAGLAGPVSGNAARVEIRHSDEELRARAYASKADRDFNNSSSGVTGGRKEFGASAAYQINKALSVNAEVQKFDDEITLATTRSASLGVDLKLSDRLTIGVGARQVNQSYISLVPLVNSNCFSGGSSSTPGYNVGFGIDQVGNQQIDPATGRPVVCSTLPTGATVAPDLDATSLYGRLSWRATDTLTFSGELQQELSDSTTQSKTTLYRLGADWRVADKTRLYSRYEFSRAFNGAYGLGVGETGSNLAFGIDTQYAENSSLYNEYRLRDSASGRDVQRALGLRNGWRVAEGLRLNTNVERLVSTAGDATAAGIGLEYTGSELWKGSGRLEWRQDNSNTNYLITLSAARKIDRDWTLLAREYYSLVKPRVAAATDSKQNRFQVGFAFRPVDNNQFDALALYERRSEENVSAGIDSGTDIISFRGNYHPSRAWLFTARYAFRRVDELLLGTVRDTYTAQLVGGRVTYDITNRWSVGALANVLVGQGGARQYAYGLEVGYVVVDNLLATVGYNFRGFKDDQLTGGDYTTQGLVLGLRYKFDEDVFGKSNPQKNVSLTPASDPTQANAKK
ncbi:MAG: outer membrane protein [Burkholderiaceae bacterium]